MVKLSTLAFLEAYEIPCDNGHIYPSNPGLLLGPLVAKPQNGFMCSDSGFGLMVQTQTEGYAEVPKLVTWNSTISALRHHFQEPGLAGISFEVWITPTTSANSTPLAPIITVGKQSMNGELGLSGCDGYDFLLAQDGTSLQLSYTDNDAAKSCRILPLSHELTPVLTQVFVSLGPRQVTSSKECWDTAVFQSVDLIFLIPPTT